MKMLTMAQLTITTIGGRSKSTRRFVAEGASRKSRIRTTGIIELLFGLSGMILICLIAPKS
jgi:hypothetical protein